MTLPFSFYFLISISNVENTKINISCRNLEILKSLESGKDGELWLVDAINKLAEKERCLACEIKGGQFYDTGNKLAYHKTIVDFMLEDKEIGGEIKKYMDCKIKENK